MGHAPCMCLILSSVLSFQSSFLKKSFFSCLFEYIFSSPLSSLCPSLTLSLPPHPHYKLSSTFLQLYIVRISFLKIFSILLLCSVLVCLFFFFFFNVYIFSEFELKYSLPKPGHLTGLTLYALLLDSPSMVMFFHCPINSKDLSDPSVQLT